MSTISRQTTWADNQVLNAAALNAEFDNIVNDYNGSITNANISASAAIAYSKLNLALSIVNADISASAAIATSKINVTFPSGTILGTTDTQTLTNKRITKRTGTVASAAEPTINTDNVDMFTITALAVAITSMTTNLSGTPTLGQTLIIRILDDGTARAITWGASFASRGATLPTTTTLSKYLYVGFIYNTTTSTWDCIAVVNEV